jgi:hypothetical protein
MLASEVRNEGILSVSPAILNIRGRDDRMSQQAQIAVLPTNRQDLPGDGSRGGFWQVTADRA